MSCIPERETSKELQMLPFTAANSNLTVGMRKVKLAIDGRGRDEEKPARI